MINASTADQNKEVIFRTTEGQIYITVILSLDVGFFFIHREKDLPTLE